MVKRWEAGRGPGNKASKLVLCQPSLCGCVSFQFQVPGSSATLEPHLCVTVLAYCGSVANKVGHSNQTIQCSRVHIRDSLIFSHDLVTY